MATSFERMKARGDQASLFAMRSPPPGFQTVVDGRGQKYNVKTSQLNQVHRTPQVALVEPATALGGAWNAGSVDFVVPRDSLHMFESFNLELKITNSTGNAIKLIPAPLLVQYIDVFIDNKRLIRMTPEALFTGLSLMKEEELNSIVTTSNMTTKFAANSNTVADASSATYYIHTDHISPLKTFGGLFLPGLKGDIRIRAQLQPASVAFITGSTCTINHVKLRVFGYELPNDEYIQMQDLYMNGFVDYKYLDIAQFQSVVGSETSGTVYTRTLTNINGLVPFMFVIERDDAPTAAETVTFLSLQTIQILDSSGRPVLGNQSLDDPFVRGPYATKFLPETSMQNEVYCYPISFCKSIHLATQVGAVTGCQAFNGQWAI